MCKQIKRSKKIHDITLGILATVNFQNYGSEENKRIEFLKQYKETYKFVEENLDKETV